MIKMRAYQEKIKSTLMELEKLELPQPVQNCCISINSTMGKSSKFICKFNNIVEFETFYTFLAYDFIICIKFENMYYAFESPNYILDEKNYIIYDLDALKNTERNNNIYYKSSSNYTYIICRLR